HGPQAWRLAFWAPQLFIWLHFGIYLVGTIKDTGGPSMLPLLPVSDSAVWISRKYRRGRGIQVGDVISFAHPIGDYNAIKRVVGMPGDFVLRDTPGEGEGMMIQVPRGHCYVVGDNLPWSRDSRMLGPIPLALIQGKVNATLWPFTRIGRVENGLAPAL
ncbi:signal peptidase-like protein I, partial [Eremomyces bilateralis CBS 781.70]